MNEKILNIALVFPRLKNEPEIPKKDDFKNETLDLVVFPEDYIKSDDSLQISKLAELSQNLFTCILVGVSKKHDEYKDVYWQTIMRFLPNCDPKIIYYKHTTADVTAFEPVDWKPEKALPVFSVSDVKIGCTICHDSYLGLLQRFLSKQGVKIWINPSYTNPKDEKWSAIHRLRAVENGIFSLCTLHDDGSSKTHPFGYGPDGKELKGYPSGYPTEIKYLSQCTETGIYVVKCDLNTPQARLNPNLLPETRKNITKTRKGQLKVVLINGKLYIKNNDKLIQIDSSQSIDVGGKKIFIGLIKDDSLFDIKVFFNNALEAYRHKEALLFWNLWEELPVMPEKLVDIMLGRTLEFCAPVVLSDKNIIFEVTEIASNYKMMRRKLVNDKEISIDLERAWGLKNAFKMTSNHLQAEGIEEYRKLFAKSLDRYRSLI